MNINLEKVLKSIERNLIPVEDISLDKLHKAYDGVTKLRSQLIGIIYENEFGFTGSTTKNSKLPDLLSEGTAGRETVTLTIYEPLSFRTQAPL